MAKLKTILLVDDCQATNFIHRLVIDNYGCAETVVECRDGAQALDYLRSGVDKHPQPELILLDINMPVMNGWEFLEAYENLPSKQKAGVVVVMLTTSQNPDDRSKAEERGLVSEFTLKPLDEEKLEAVLKKYYPSAVRSR